MPGWSRDPTKLTDFILWYWKDTGRYCLIDFHQLCHVVEQHWEEWAETYGTHQQKTTAQGGRCYHSECIFVPRRQVWAAIYRCCGGNPCSKKAEY